MGGTDAIIGILNGKCIGGLHPHFTAGGFINIRKRLAAGNAVTAQHIVKILQQVFPSQLALHNRLAGRGGQSDTEAGLLCPLQQLTGAGLDRNAFQRFDFMINLAEGSIEFFRGKICTIVLPQDVTGMLAGSADGEEKDRITVGCTVILCSQVPAPAYQLLRIQNDTIHIKNQSRFGHCNILRIMVYSSGFKLSMVSGRCSMMLV